MGRSRKPGKRHPSGQLRKPGPSERTKDMRDVAMQARERVFALSEEAATRMPETSVLGRLRATRELSWRQYEAGALYREAKLAYDRALLARGVPSAGDLNRSRAHPSDTEPDGYAETVANAIRQWDRCERALAEANREDRHASYTVKAVVLADWQADYFTPALRVALNHLARLFRVEDRVESDERPEAAA